MNFLPAFGPVPPLPQLPSMEDPNKYSVPNLPYLHPMTTYQSTGSLPQIRDPLPASVPPITSFSHVSELHGSELPEINPKSLASRSSQLPRVSEPSLPQISEPSLPQVPESSLPRVSEYQAMPSLSRVPEYRTMPSLPRVSESQVMPSLPQVPEYQAMPSLPQVPESQVMPRTEVRESSAKMPKFIDPSNVNPMSGVAFSDPLSPPRVVSPPATLPREFEGPNFPLSETEAASSFTLPVAPSQRSYSLLPEDFPEVIGQLPSSEELPKVNIPSLSRRGPSTNPTVPIAMPSPPTTGSFILPPTVRRTF